MLRGHGYGADREVRLAAEVVRVVRFVIAALPLIRKGGVLILNASTAHATGNAGLRRVDKHKLRR